MNINNIFHIQHHSIILEYLTLVELDKLVDYLPSKMKKYVEKKREDRYSKECLRIIKLKRENINMNFYIGCGLVEHFRKNLTSDFRPTNRNYRDIFNTSDNISKFIIIDILVSISSENLTSGYINNRDFRYMIDNYPESITKHLSSY